MMILEGNVAYVPGTFWNKDGQAEAPSSASYRIDCLTTGQEVLGDTAFTPAAQFELEIPSSLNALLGTDGKPERRRVTVTGTYGLDDKVIGAFVYTINGIEGTK